MAEMRSMVRSVSNPVKAPLSKWSQSASVMVFSYLARMYSAALTRNPAVPQAGSIRYPTLIQSNDNRHFEHPCVHPISRVNTVFSSISENRSACKIAHEKSERCMSRCFGAYTFRCNILFFYSSSSHS